ncbi:MAG: hypothetical protein ACRD36_04090 [Candidatus Acidiferrum sp.]
MHKLAHPDRQLKSNPRYATRPSLSSRYVQVNTLKGHLLYCWLPYGKWTCADGREVLFNRHYEPIWERSPGMPTQRADPDEWVHYIRREYIYIDDQASPLPRLPPRSARGAAQNMVRCLRVLKEFGASWEPIAGYAAVRRASDGDVLAAG